MPKLSEHRGFPNHFSMGSYGGEWLVQFGKICPKNVCKAMKFHFLARKWIRYLTQFFFSNFSDLRPLVVISAQLSLHQLFPCAFLFKKCDFLFKKCAFLFKKAQGKVVHKCAQIGWNFRCCAVHVKINFYFLILFSWDSCLALFLLENLYFINSSVWNNE